MSSVPPFAVSIEESGIYQGVGSRARIPEIDTKRDIFYFQGGWTALMWATYKGRSPTVTMLLGRGADVNAHGNFHISSLLWAAGRGYPDIVKDLIAHGAKVNVGDKVIHR